jgi:hypothetical protein
MNSPRSPLGRLGFGSRRGTIPILATVAFATLLATPAMTLAADTRIVFGDTYEGMRLGDSCFAGRAPRSVPLHLVWKSAAGAVKANTYVPTTEYGSWGYCSAYGATLAEGDLLKATAGSYSRTFVVPLVSIRVDRVHDTFHGRAPAGSAVTLWYMYRRCCPDYEQHEDLTADSEGKWLFSNYGDPVDDYDAHVEWQSAKGDTMSDWDVAPGVTVSIGRSMVSGYSHPDAQVKVVLRDGATGAWKGVAKSTVGDYGEFSAVFLDGAGQPVNVIAGDRIVGLTLASDMHFVVRDIEASADVATDVVSGTCGYRRGGEITVYRSGNWIGWSFLDTDDDGYFSVWFGDDETLGYDPANIRHGDRITVMCGVPHGDWITKSFIVP